MLIRLDPEHIHSPTHTQSLNCIPETQLMCTVIIERVGVCVRERERLMRAQRVRITHRRVKEMVKSALTALSRIIITLIIAMDVIK